ncbi:VOC family protein [Flindersiella endophytica]
MSEQHTPAIVPFLAYENATAAIDFLIKGFGFTEVERYTNDDGTIGHATLSLGDGRIFLADLRGGYESPRHHAETCEQARTWQQTPYIVNGVFAEVDDVHKHFEQAKAAGATILSEIEDAGHGVIYRAADPEGQRWMFSQR